MVFCVETPFSSERETDVTEEHIASVFRVEGIDKQETSRSIF
jgi:hypothetical protein